MNIVRFETTTIFEDEGALRAAFAGAVLFLDPGACVALSGSVGLGHAVRFGGDCRLADGVTIADGCNLDGVVLGERTQVRPYSILTDVTAGSANLLGPFCFLRDGCVIGDGCVLGAHVEAARSRFGDGVKVSHRAFIGDAEVGARTILGAGVVFCNWDGSQRQRTTVGADVIIGSGSLLVPPVSIGDGAVVAAGSTITRDVPAGARIIQKR